MRTKFSLMALLFVVLSTSISGQLLTPIPSPSDFDDNGSGLNLICFELNNKLYMQYKKDSLSNSLFSWDGTTLDSIPNPSGFNGPFSGFRQINNVYGSRAYLGYRDDNSQDHLYEFDGTTLTPFPVPPGYASVSITTVTYGGKLWLRCTTSGGRSDLVGYDGTNFNTIPTPNGFTGNGSGYLSPSVEFNGNLMLCYKNNIGNKELFQFDGTGLLYIPSPTGYNGGNNAGFDFRTGVTATHLYMRYRSNNNVLDLGVWDGTNLVVYPSPLGYNNPGAGISVGFSEFGGDIFLLYEQNNQNNDLMRFDGTALDSIPSPSPYTGNLEGAAVMDVYQNVLYLGYRRTSNYLSDLHSFDGTTLTQLPLIPGISAPAASFTGYRGIVTESPNFAYMDFADGSKTSYLVRFDGTNFRIVSNPAGYTGNGSGFSSHGGIEFQGDYYFRFKSDSGNSVLMKMTECQDQMATVSLEGCNEYLSPSGKFLWTASGTYNDTIETAGGCDSLLVVNLTITPFDSTVSSTGATLTANESGATYQWLDCGNGFFPVAGATNQSFEPSTSGSYAVAVSSGICADTSDCVSVTVVATDREALENAVRVFPNPMTDKVEVEFEQATYFGIEAMDAQGRVLVQHPPSRRKGLTVEFEAAPGIYFLRIQTDKANIVRPLVKQ